MMRTILCSCRNSLSITSSPPKIDPKLPRIDLNRGDAFERLDFSTARYKGARGGRGSGKSHYFAERLIFAGMREDIRAVCCREVQRSLDQSVKRLLEDKIEKFGLSSRFRILQTHIEVGESGRIIFQGLQNHTSDSIKSLENYKIAWVEEAHSVSQRSWDLLYPTIRAEGAEIWASWNPTSPDDPVDKFFVEESQRDPENVVLVEAQYRNNPMFPDVLKQDMERDKRRNPEKYAHIWLGQYQKQSEAQVFRNWRVDEFDTPKTVDRFYYGADWGFSVDPSVLVRCWMDGRTLYIDQEAYAVGCEIDLLPALFAGSDDRGRWHNPKGWRGIPGSTRWPIRADSARPETISYLKHRGFNISPARKGAGSVDEGIEFLQSYDIVVHPRCKHTVDELSFYSYKIDRRTDEVLPMLEDKDNHVIDALRYAVEGLRRGSGGPRIS